MRRGQALRVHLGVAREHSGRAEIRDGGVRVRDVAVAFIQFAERASHVVVGVDAGGNHRTDRLHIPAEHPADALEVARVAHVHGVGQRRHRRPRLDQAGVQIARHRVVDVGGGVKLVDRRAHPHRHDARGQVAEVAARHGDDERRAGIRRASRRGRNRPSAAAAGRG